MKRILFILIIFIFCFSSLVVFAEEENVSTTENTVVEEIVETDISQNESIQDDDLLKKLDYTNEVLTKIYFYLFLFFYVFLMFKFYELFYRLFDRIC